MTHTETSLSDWEQCKPGSLVGYAARDKSRKRRRTITKVIGIASAFMVVFFASIALLQTASTGNEPNYGGIVCSKVMHNSNFYLAGTLDKDTNSKIEQHLKLCPKCRSEMIILKKSHVNKSNREINQHRFVSALSGQASK